MNCKFGIHLGNSNVCLSVYKDGNIDVLSNKAGDRVTSTYIAILDSEEFVVGDTAKQRAGRFPGSTIINNLQFCNGDMTEEELAEALKSVPCKIEKDPFKYTLEIDDISKEVTPYEANVQLFHNIHSSAHQMCHHGEDENAEYPAVISIPGYFTDDHAKKIVQAAEESGFKIEQIINNAAAAALSYNIGQEDHSHKNESILIYRVGGLSSECSLIHVQNGLYEIEHSIHRKDLGGHILTRALADFIAEEFYKRYKLNPKESRRHMAKLVYYAEQSKHVLSTLSSTQIFIESLIDGVDVNNNISRARFESLIAPHLSKFRKPIEEILEMRKDKDKPIDRVILCGGTMKMPKLQSTISEMFKNSEILTSIPPDEVIAIGCARQASLNPDDNIPGVGFTSDVDVVPFNIYIKKSNDDEILAFPEGTQVYSVFKFKKEITEDDEKIEFSIYEKRTDSEIFNLGEIIFENNKDDIKLSGVTEFIAILKPTLVEISLL